jgi:DNA mismatch endonuclease (patch repair protein)
MTYSISIFSKYSMSGNEYIRDGRSPVPKDEVTSKVMRSNKGKNTRPEISLRKELWKNNIKGYRLHWKKVPGTPDIVFAKKKLAIFINGCFWHRCPNCNLSLPKTNTEFWKDKFDKNVERDRKKVQMLKNIGWNVIVIWECVIKNDILDSVYLIKKELEKYAD